MAHKLRPSKNKGIALPAVLFICIVCAILVLVMAQVSSHKARAVKLMGDMDIGSVGADSGIQLGLAQLSYRLGFVPARLNSGVLVSGTTRYIEENDLKRYDQQSKPACFWTEFVNDLDGPNTPSNFTVDATSSVASFTVLTSSVSVKVSLFYANGPLNGYYAAIGNNYNDVWLRYYYEITSTDLKSGKSTRVASYRLKDYTIQVHVLRSLSRYNLFAENNSLPPPDTAVKVYDSTSYAGKVYSKNTFYVNKNPRYGDTVEIGQTASPHWQHKDQASPETGFLFLNNAGVPVPEQNPNHNNYVNPPLDLPSGMERADQRAISLGTKTPTFNGIYVTTASVSTTSSGSAPNTPVSVYVWGGATVTMRSPGAGTTTYYDIVCPTAGGGIPGNVTVERHVWEQMNPTFLIFVEGPLLVSGKISQHEQVTIAADNDVTIADSITYDLGLPSPTTVLGLVSWGGNILLTKNPPGGSGMTLDLHAVIMTPNGGLGAEGFANFPANYANNAGTARHVGSIIRRWALPTHDTGGTLGWGLGSQYDVDLKDKKAPPYFPGNGRYEVRDATLLRVMDRYHFL